MAIVGIVPQRKRLDRAIDLLIALRKTDQTWRLIVKGNLPHDYAFMHAPGRSKELEYYDTQYERIRMNGLEDSVLFEDILRVCPIGIERWDILFHQAILNHFIIQ